MTVLAAVAATVLLLAVLVAPGATSEATVQDEEHLPDGLRYAMVVATGDHVFVLGGLKEGSNPTRDILRIDPDTMEVMPVGQLPAARFNGAAVHLDDRIYVFGGVDLVAGAPTPSDKIMEFDPATGNARTLSLSTLPRPLFGMAAATDGERAYIFGGFHLDAMEQSDRIIEFDPAKMADKATYTSQRLPDRLMGAAAAYDGSRIVVAGGTAESDDDDWMDDRVHWFDPHTRSLETASFTLPQAVRDATAVAAEGVVYVLGGALNMGATAGSDKIIKITMDDAWNGPFTLDPERWRAGAGLVADRIVLAGGQSQEAGFLRNVALIDLGAAPGSGKSEPEPGPEPGPDPGPDPDNGTGASPGNTTDDGAEDEAKGGADPSEVEAQDPAGDDLDTAGGGTPDAQDLGGKEDPLPGETPAAGALWVVVVLSGALWWGRRKR